VEAPSTPAPVPVSHRNRTLAIIAIVVIAVAIFAGAYFAGLFGSSSKPWLFKGAYATYSGETSYSGATYNFTIRVQVVDFNSTAADLLYYVNFGSSSSSYTNQTTQWTKFSPIGGIIPLAQPDFSLSRTYDTTRLVGDNTYDCTAYEHTAQSNGATGTITAYLSNSAGFLIEFTYSVSGSSGTTISIDMPVTHTNISGL